MPLLFSIETDAFSLTWSSQREESIRFEDTPALPPFGLTTEPISIPVTFNPSAGTRLFEQTDYVLFIQSKTMAPVALRHQDPLLLRSLQSREGGRVVFGTLNFGSQVGYSRFVVEVGGRDRFAFTVEVFPSKLDYQADYLALRADVEHLARYLALTALQPTFSAGREDAEAPFEDAAWLRLLWHYADMLEQALHFLAGHPLRETQASPSYSRAEQVRHPGSVVRRAIRQGQGSGVWQSFSDGMPVHTHLPASVSVPSLDTPAHRWLAFEVDQIGRQLASLLAIEQQRPPSLRQEAVVESLEDLHRRLIHWQRLEPLRLAVGDPPPNPPLSLLLAPGYREAWQACQRLKQGLRLEGGPLELALKDLHLLYEYWCFLTLAHLLAQHTGHRSSLRTLVHLERDGIRLRLRQGRRHALSFPLPESQRLELIYNPLFRGKGYLVPQQPDILLVHHRPGHLPDYYLLDAKYRLDRSPGYIQRYGHPGPPADALNTLHRYRDAIRGRHRQHRPVVQALALYPYQEPRRGMTDQSPLYTSLADRGLGAIPLLPQNRYPLDHWIASLPPFIS